MNPHQFEKYEPPEYPPPADAPAGMGVESFPLIPAGLVNGPVCPDATFPMLDRADRLAVLAMRHQWAVLNAQEAAMNAPFEDIRKGNFHA